MSSHRFGALLQLVAEAARVESEFGAHALAGLVRTAETIEHSVYVPGSLVRTPTGLRLRLANPPLRIGAFSRLRAIVDGTAVPSEAVRFRAGPSAAWRRASSLSEDAPLDLEAGTAMEVDLDGPTGTGSGPVAVRLEFQNVAIPPLVWLEIRDTPREAGAD